MKLLTTFLLSSVATATGHPSMRGGSDDGSPRQLFPGPPPTCGAANPAYQPCCGASPCWCDLDSDVEDASLSISNDVDTCPDYPAQGIYNIPFSPGEDVIDFFESLSLDNDAYKYLQICQPDLSSSQNLQGDQINPALLDAILPGEPSCKKARKSNKGSKRMCGIKFKHDGTDISPTDYNVDCSSLNRADSYKVKTFNNMQILTKKGFFVLHEGACGVCSTAQDLAAYMTYSFPQTPESLTLSQIPGICFQCVVAAFPPETPPSAQTAVGLISSCLQSGLGPSCPAPPIGFSPKCATAWAINTYFSGLPNAAGGCLDECTLLAGGEAAYNATTCELHPCLQCDDSVNGDFFDELAGMTRRGAGLHTVLPRPCGSLASIVHTCVAEN